MNEAAQHVVTLVLPRSARADVSIAVRGRTVTVTGSGGYRHEVAMSPEADTAHLDVQLYRDYLELRTPHISGQ